MPIVDVSLSPATARRVRGPGRGGSFLGQSCPCVLRRLGVSPGKWVVLSLVGEERVWTELVAPSRNDRQQWRDEEKSSKKEEKKKKKKKRKSSKQNKRKKKKKNKTTVSVLDKTSQLVVVYLTARRCSPECRQRLLVSHAVLFDLGLDLAVEESVSVVAVPLPMHIAPRVDGGSSDRGGSDGGELDRLLRDLDVDEEATELTVDSVVDGSVDGDSDIDNNTDKGEDNVFPIARRVQIVRIRSPHSSGHAAYDRQLLRFFERPQRVPLHVGQVIAVPLALHGNGSDNDDEDDNAEQWSSTFDLSLLDDPMAGFPTILDAHQVPQYADEAIQHRVWHSDGAAQVPFVYFRVLSAAIQPSAVARSRSRQQRFFAVQPGFTELSQAGSINSRAPRLLSASSSSSSNHGASPSEAKLRELLLPLVHRDTRRFLQPRHCVTLLHGPRRSGKRSCVSRVASALGVHLVEVSAFDMLGSNERDTAHKLQRCFEETAEFAPVILHVRRLGAWQAQLSSQALERDSALADKLRQCTRQQGNVIFVGSAEDVDDISSSVRRCFTHEIATGAPDLAQRQRVLRSLMATVDEADALAARTAGMTTGDLRYLVADAGRRSLAGGHDRIVEDALDQALEAYKKRSASASGTLATVPNVTWADVGGLEHVKREVMDTVELPLRHPELFARGVKQRSGILLYGPPGTGKTLIAKAVATECSLNFISVKGPELLNMYVGESEKNVRDVFVRARNCKPCVLFFDELDSLAPNRGQGSDGGGVMDRVVSQLLTELDGMGDSTDLFIIGATNRPDLIEPALLRPGRLDKCVYLGVSEDSGAQLKILRALTRKFNLAADVDLAAIAEQCPFTFTGADLYALCSDAMLHAVKRKTREIVLAAGADAGRDDVDDDDGGDGDGEGEEKEKHDDDKKSDAVQRRLLKSFLASLPDDHELLSIRVQTEDFELARRQLTPSLSVDELNKYRELKRKFNP